MASSIAYVANNKNTPATLDSVAHIHVCCQCRYRGCCMLEHCNDLIDCGEVGRRGINGVLTNIDKIQCTSIFA